MDQAQNPAADDAAVKDALAKAEKARQAEADAQKSAEAKKVEAAAQKVDDATAAAVGVAGTTDATAKPMTAVEAGVLANVPQDMPASDHAAQKFSNDPANPHPAPGVDMGKDLVKLKIQKPDVEADVYCEVPEKMVGDYERAGWNRV